MVIAEPTPRSPFFPLPSLSPVSGWSLCSLLGARYPPGHGDLYRSFYDSGLLQQLIDGVRLSQLIARQLQITPRLAAARTCRQKNHGALLVVCTRAGQGVGLHLQH